MKTLTFTEEFRYKDSEEGISITVLLTYNGTSRRVDAKVDPGASVCLFSHEEGLKLGIPIEQGIPIRLSGMTGTLEAYGHEVTLQTGNISFQSFVYFAKYPGLPRNLLGCQGWMRNLCVGVIDYDCTLYLSPYDAQF